jgi:hypothetical protein
MSNEFRHRICAVALNVPHSYSAEHLCDLVWAQVGLRIEPFDVSVKKSGKFSSTAFLWVTEGALVDMLGRNFAALQLENGPLRFEPKIWKQGPNPRRSVRQFHGNNCEENKVGIRKISGPLPWEDER